jgi:hypothetical protein
MDWIEFTGDAPFMAFKAVQAEGRLSSCLATAGEIDYAASELKRQIDITAKQMKEALQKPPKDPFNA